MQPFDGYEAKKTGGNAPLPAGGYVAKILKAEEVTCSWGAVILLSFDIAEGEHKDHFKTNYNNQTGEDKKWKGTYRIYEPAGDGSEKDGWTKRSFGNAMWAIEASNPGYHWDWNETNLKNKTVGILFRNREWEFNGKTGMTTEACTLVSADEVRNGEFKMPADKLLSESKGGSKAANQVEESTDDLPF